MNQGADSSRLLQGRQYSWIVTGGAGFIGSHLAENLLKANQRVKVIDNFATGKMTNIDDIKSNLGLGELANFSFHEADIRDRPRMAELVRGADFVLHQAALGSVPRSIEDPWTSHDVNVNGFVSMLEAARAAKVKRFIYASSSSIYGDHPLLPKVESQIGNPLSPYAATKRANEIYARAYAAAYGMTLIGLRYFNVFGARQDPEGQYAAVIPRWFKGVLKNTDVAIYGDGETSRDFCYIDNVVQANLKAALSPNVPQGQAFELNIAAQRQTTLNQLYALIKHKAAEHTKNAKIMSHKPQHRDFRPGDIRHSLADISLAKELIDYVPTVDVDHGLSMSLQWYMLIAKNG
jgi:UDP-N-acetylglucosamine 4-epimerase